jgi:hypothetical protein
MWWIERIAPRGQVHIIAGTSGAGKSSYLASYLVPSVLRGEWEGWRVHGRRVHWVITDRDRTDWVLMCERWPVLRQLTVTVATELGVRPTLDMVAADIRRQCPEGVDLVIVDVLPMLFAGDLNDYVSAHGLMGHAWRITQSLGTTMLAVMHARKHQGPARESPDPFDRVLGSMALRGAAGTVWVLEPVRVAAGVYARLHMRPHHAPERVYYYERDDRGGFVPVPAIPYTERWLEWLSLLPPGTEIDEEDIDCFPTKRRRRRAIRQAVRAGWLEEVGDGLYRVCRPSVSSGSSGVSSGPSGVSG